MRAGTPWILCVCELFIYQLSRGDFKIEHYFTREPIKLWMHSTQQMIIFEWRQAWIDTSFWISDPYICYSNSNSNSNEMELKWIHNVWPWVSTFHMNWIHDWGRNSIYPTHPTPAAPSLSLSFLPARNVQCLKIMSWIYNRTIHSTNWLKSGS